MKDAFARLKDLLVRFLKDRLAWLKSLTHRDKSDTPPPPSPPVA